ncbi:response regulator [Paenibacillus nasutitermitis]|uniref:Transcriptional regulatory protein GlnL n=1 Tax=Paenibacillus nasutitermitis TaxID=1652958 RepID=A0A916ZDM5_9BACL|nr:response regulator [Paenibacillus nasutitermitis]GGD90717.1 transcriptional regulatory protein GlnL [Paenibacillus nasutitermitis]
MLSFGIVDDDSASRLMLQFIIEKSGLGEVVVMAGNGTTGEQGILIAKPDVVLIDLLMPDQDGIETIYHLKRQGFGGKYVMISQIENKEMIGKAYLAGIEFYIQKPINRVEVEAVLSRVHEQWRICCYLGEIKASLSKLNNLNPELAGSFKKRTNREIIQSILMELGIIGEGGSRDIAEIMEHLVHSRHPESLPPLKELYEVAAQANKGMGTDIEKESKAVEQRIRRTVMGALSNLASIGLTDFSNPKFEHYAPLYFDFQDVRLKMKEMDESLKPDKGKVNIKKFMQVFYLEVLDRIREEQHPV